MMKEPEPIADVFHVDGSRWGHIRCPTCQSVYPIRQHQTKGAGYAKATMTKLKAEQFNFLTWWLSNKYYNQKLTKKKLVELFENSGGKISDPDSRFSELFGLELIIAEKNGNEVLYSLDIHKTVRVLSKGGKLQ